MSALAVATVVDDGKLNRLVAAQLQKTKMCAMHQRGTCRDPKCRFAHSQSELRIAPNLMKTAICRMYTRGQCRNSTCKFAHGEEELRVTPTVYKTQLCNFHTRGHCQKGNRCRHAHGDDELRAFSETSTVPPSPSIHDDTKSCDAESSPCHHAGRVDEIGQPHEPADVSLAQELRALTSMPHAGHWSPSGMMGATPEWWAGMLAGGANGPQAELFTPPTTHMMYSRHAEQPTPEKFRERVPPFPGMQQRGPDIAEPMKVSLSSSRFAALPERETPQPSAQQEELSNMMNFHAQYSWAAQAKMDYELAVAQLKVQELQAKRQLYSVAQFTATANATSRPAVCAVAESHFENMWQTLKKFPPRPISPADVVPPQTIRPAMPPGLCPAVASASAQGGGESPAQDSPRAIQSWHPTDISHQCGTAFVI